MARVREKTWPRDHEGSGLEKTVVIIEGNTLRSQNAQPEREKELSPEVAAARARALQMNFGYVLFLTVAAIISVTVCINYLKLQFSYTTLQKTSTRLETQLSSMKLDNDTEYNRIVSSVDLEEVRERATGSLGMVYKTSDQIVTFEVPDNDYVRQFRDVSD